MHVPLCIRYRKLHSEREKPPGSSARQAGGRPRAAARLTETRPLVRADVAVREAAPAGAVVGGESAQRAVEPARPTLQVVAVHAGEALRTVAVARQAGTVAGVAQTVSRLVETAASERR